MSNIAREIHSEYQKGLSCIHNIHATIQQIVNDLDAIRCSTLPASHQLYWRKEKKILLAQCNDLDDICEEYENRTIFIITHNNVIITTKFHPKLTTNVLRSRVNEKLQTRGIHIGEDEFYLQTGLKILEDNKILADYDIHKNSIITLIPRLKGGHRIVRYAIFMRL